MYKVKVAVQVEDESRVINEESAGFPSELRDDAMGVATAIMDFVLDRCAEWNGAKSKVVIDGHR